MLQALDVLSASFIIFHHYEQSGAMNQYSLSLPMAETYTELASR